MNKEKGGRCFIGVTESAAYNVQPDPDGNNSMTGEGSDGDGSQKRFTLEEIEVYHMTFE